MVTSKALQDVYLLLVLKSLQKRPRKRPCALTEELHINLFSHCRRHPEAVSRSGFRWTPPVYRSCAPFLFGAALLFRFPLSMSCFHSCTASKSFHLGSVCAGLQKTFISENLFLVARSTFFDPVGDGRRHCIAPVVGRCHSICRSCAPLVLFTPLSSLSPRFFRLSLCPVRFLFFCLFLAAPHSPFFAALFHSYLNPGHDDINVPGEMR